MKRIELINAMAILLLAASALSSCKQESADIPTSSGMNLKLTATTNSFNVPVLPGYPERTDPELPMIKWDTARLEVSRLIFEAEKKSEIGMEEKQEVKYIWTGPAMVDLFNVNAILGKIMIPPGTYDEVKLIVVADKDDSNGRPDFYLSGIYTNSRGFSIPIFLIMNEDIRISTELENVTLTVDGLNPNAWNINLFLQKMFSAVSQQDLDQIILTNGRIIISSSHNTQLFDKILKNLEKIGGSRLAEAG